MVTLFGEFKICLLLKSQKTELKFGELDLNGILPDKKPEESKVSKSGGSGELKLKI